jgi:hypothetical protein
MLRYVNYDPAQHAGQAVYQVAGFSLPDGGWDVNVRAVTDPAELAAAKLDPTFYVVTEDWFPEDGWRDVEDAARGFRPMPDAAA